MLAYERAEPVLIHNLRKEFPGRSGQPVKVAVADLSLGIPAGQCFGLLGENGAGKTTTCHVLLALYPPSAGQAFVNGWNVETEADAVHVSVGFCPQHDILWDDLSVEEHLLYYARVKGVPIADERKHVDQCVLIDRAVEGGKCVRAFSCGE